MMVNLGNTKLFLCQLRPRVRFAARSCVQASGKHVYALILITLKQRPLEHGFSQGAAHDVAVAHKNEGTRIARDSALVTTTNSKRVETSQPGVYRPGRWPQSVVKVAISQELLRYKFAGDPLKISRGPLPQCAAKIGQGRNGIGPGPDGIANGR